MNSSGDFEGVYHLLDRMVVAMGAEALDVIWPRLQEGETADLDLAETSGLVAPGARYLIESLLSILAEHGYLAWNSNHSRYILFSRPKLVDLKCIIRETIDENGGDPVFTLARRCFDGLPAFLAGRRTGVEILFPRGDTSAWAALHDRSLVMRHYADAAADLAAKRLHRHYRCLEIGGGTGAATRRLLKSPAVQSLSAYHFTDVGLSFVREAQARFGEVPGFEATIFDLNQDPVAQGFAPKSYDLVLGVNALHVARDLPKAARGLANLLRPGGWLVLGEGAPPIDHRWRCDPIFAYLEDWWRVPTDTSSRLRPGFLSLEA